MSSKSWSSCPLLISIHTWSHFSGLPSKIKWNSTAANGKTIYHLYEIRLTSLPMLVKPELHRDELPNSSKRTLVQILSWTELVSSWSVKTIGARKPAMCRSSSKFLLSTRTTQRMKACFITRGIRAGGGVSPSTGLTWLYYLSLTISNTKIHVLSASTAGNGL